MSSVTAFQAKTRFGELLERVSKGEEVIITRHDKPVARLIPEGVPRQEQARRALAGLAELRKRISERGGASLTNQEVRAAIEEGRR
jgi:prevent-host-death family protein